MVSRYSIAVSKISDAGRVMLKNRMNKSQLVLHEYQPFNVALFKARQLAELIDCEVFVNGSPDDLRHIETPQYPKRVEPLFETV